MSVLYSPEQREIAATVARVVEDQFDLETSLNLLTTTGAYDAGLFALAIRQGWLGAGIPEEYGGAGLGLAELGIVAQALGRAPAGMPFLSVCHGAALAILKSGAEFARLSQIAAGEAIATVSIIEKGELVPARPSVCFDGACISGRVEGIVAGQFANIAIVLAHYKGQPCLILTELQPENRRVINSFDNSRGYADLVFDRHPATLMATGEQALDIAFEVLSTMAIIAAHEQVGGAEKLLKIGCDYANTRKAFGQPIGAFQSVKHRLAELYALIEIARVNAIHAAFCSGRARLAAAAAARLSACEAYETAARDCIQIHGGIGVTWQAGLHLHQRRARSLAMEWGNAMLWEDVLVSELMGQMR